ncbi:MAG: anthranilate phosphoribosyltransferase [Pseudomonadota bacterium]|nr:anthranilate phosphoribosyltransferase [Pseudomonadota bacterium]
MSEIFSDMLNRVLDKNSLTEKESYELMMAMAAEKISPALSGALLAGLRAKGETADEIRGFAKGMRDLAIKPQIPEGEPTVDTVGTGGDGSGSLNLSTGTGLLAAACGIKVVKHGNRSISSRSGSADMLESIGMSLPQDEETAISVLNNLGFTFLFSPAFHPAMKAIMPVRNALGVRTVFNMLGPLSNPAAPPYQLIGAFSLEAAKLMAETLSGLPIERAFVVHGAAGWDEATPLGDFLLYDVKAGSIQEQTRQPEDYELNRCEATDLLGNDSEYNANELERVFSGEDQGAHRDALLMGVSLVLELMGKTSNPIDGVKIAANAIDNFEAIKFLNKLKNYFLAQ